MSCDHVFERCPNDPEQIVSVVLVKFCVFDGNHSVDEIWRQLFVRHCLAVLDIDLAEDFAVAIQNYTGRFHLIQLAQIERGGLRFEIEEDAGNEDRYKDRQHRPDRNRNIKPRSEIPWPTKAISRRWSKVCAR